MRDLQFQVLFNGISVIAGRQEDDNERLCAMEPCLGLQVEPLTARLASQHLTHLANGALQWLWKRKRLNLWMMEVG